jgi:hypothetical protein
MEHKEIKLHFLLWGKYQVVEESMCPQTTRENQVRALSPSPPIFFWLLSSGSKVKAAHLSIIYTEALTELCGSNKICGVPSRPIYFQSNSRLPSPCRTALHSIPLSIEMLRV